jgi:hypothetical protein
MAKNWTKGDWHRNWAIKDRTQFFNSHTWLYYKRDKDTGQIMDCKTSDDTKFKWVELEK